MSEYLTADSAREKTLERKGSRAANVHSLVAHACSKIEAASKSGEWEIRNPFQGLRGCYTDFDIRDAKEKLVELGYTIYNYSGQLTVGWKKPGDKGNG
mgnify:CR=1 FL=1